MSKDCSCPVGTLWRKSGESSSTQLFMFCHNDREIVHYYLSSLGTAREYTPSHFADYDQWVSVGCWPGATVLPMWPGNAGLEPGDVISLFAEKATHEFCYVLYKDESNVWISRNPGQSKQGCAEISFTASTMLGWERGIVIRPSGVGMPKKEAEPVIRTLRGLKKEATQRAQRQGHKLRAWKDLSEQCSHSTCVQCSATIVMDITPSKTGQYIFGAGYNASCEEWKRMTLNGFAEQWQQAQANAKLAEDVLDDDEGNVLPQQPVTEQPSFEVAVVGMDQVANPDDGLPYTRRFISLPEAEEYLTGLQNSGLVAMLNRLTVATQTS